jgi:type IV secretory pathway VirB4 component
VIFFFDRDRGGELLVRAVNGTYLEVRAGEPSGLAPLRGLQNTPADREFLERWIKALIILDGHGPLPPQDDGRISRAVKAIMRMPIELRSFEVCGNSSVGGRHRGPVCASSAGAGALRSGGLSTDRKTKLPSPPE